MKVGYEADNEFYRPQPVIMLTGGLNQGKPNALALSS